jgi:predicted acyltransferase
MSDSATKVDRPAYPAGRLMSVDALRGFDMFWILGVDEAVHAFGEIYDPPAVEAVKTQFTHVDWEGFVFEDLIFPLFVFIVGVSIVLSLGKLIANKGRGGALKRVLIRSFVLYALGFIYYYVDLGEVRLLGVLQRIALCYLFTGMLFCFLRLRGLVTVLVTLLVAYWALMCFVPVPGVEPHSFAEGRNLANYIDAKFLPGFKWDGDHDPEGLLSTLPAVATCLLGVLAGLLLKNDAVGPYRKVAVLLLAGAASVVVGYVWGLQFPVIKKIWTSSYVLVAGGYSAILLGIFYLVLDVWKRRRWATMFVWIGTNAIALYIIAGLGNLAWLTERFTGANLKETTGPLLVLVLHVLTIVLVILLARFLYRRQIFIRA